MLRKFVAVIIIIFLLSLSNIVPMASLIGQILQRKLPNLGMRPHMQEFLCLNSDYNETLEEYLVKYNRTLFNIYNNTISPELNATASQVLKNLTTTQDATPDMFSVVDNVTVSVLSKYLSEYDVSFVVDGDGAAPDANYTIEDSEAAFDSFSLSDVPPGTSIMEISSSTSTASSNSGSSSSPTPPKPYRYFSTGKLQILLVYVKFKRTYTNSLQELLYHLELMYHRALQLIALCPTLKSFLPETSHGYIPEVKIFVTPHWYQLPRSKQYYLELGSREGRKKLIEDILRLVDPDYYMPKYDMIGIMHDGGHVWDPSTDTIAWAKKPFSKDLDGQNIWVRSFCCSVEHPPRIILHEIGHLFGHWDGRSYYCFADPLFSQLPEACMNFIEIYHLRQDHPFCIMSKGELPVGSLEVLSNALTSYPVHYCAFNKFRIARWGYSRHVYYIDLTDFNLEDRESVSFTVYLDPLATPLVGVGHYHAIEIKTGDPMYMTHFYVEARERTGWDAGIPSEGVLAYLVHNSWIPYLIDAKYETESSSDAPLQVGDTITIIVPFVEEGYAWFLYISVLNKYPYPNLEGVYYYEVQITALYEVFDNDSGGSSVGLPTMRVFNFPLQC